MISRRITCALVLAWTTLLAAHTAHGLEIPPYRSAVNDLANVLSRSEAGRLEQRISAYRDSTGIEIGVLVVPTLDGAPIEDFAHDVFKKWGIGQASRDNGILFLVAWNDRAARIEVGYGVEAALTDLEAGRLVSRTSLMAERFRERDVYGGFDAVLDGIQMAVAGDYDPPERRATKQPPQVALFTFFTMMMFILFISALVRKRARKMGVWGHGSWGAGLGGLGGLGGFGRGLGGGRSSGGGFTFGGGSSGGGGASGGW